MTSKNQVYCISISENEGHDNLGHSIKEISPSPSPAPVAVAVPASSVCKKRFVVTENLPNNSDMTPTSMQAKIGARTGVVIDVIIFLAVILWMSLIEFGLIPHIKQGFYCDDRSIRYKYDGDTVTATMLGISVVIPFFLIWIVEYTRYQSEPKDDARARKTLVRTTLYFKEYSVGILGKLVIVETLKILVGELRPHFLDTCIPDKAINCTSRMYIQDYTCTNKVDSYFFITDSARSFPSGHSSISFFEAIFLIWYFQRRFPKGRSYALLPFIQCLCLCWACFCGTSRISDNRHHWWDVLAGAIFGVLFAALTCFVLCKNFRKNIQTLDVRNQNGSTDRHTSVRRLLSDISSRDDVTMNHINPS